MHGLSRTIKTVEHSAIIIFYKREILMIIVKKKKPPTFQNTLFTPNFASFFVSKRFIVQRTDINKISH